MLRRDVTVSWIATLGYMGMIFLESSWPSVPGVLPIPQFDKVLHFGAFFVLAVLWMESLFKLGVRGKRAFWIAFIVASLYGLSDEFHQSFVPGRDVEFFDWVADTLGGAFGAWLWLKYRKAPMKIGTFKF